MPEHSYKIIELVGASTESWEKAAASVIATASKHLRDLRIAEVVAMDIHLLDSGQPEYRTRLKVSFKYHGDEAAA